MNLITPSQALTFIVNFNNRVDRLVKNEYSNIRFRTYDLTKLESEYKKIVFSASIGIHNKNKDRAKEIINDLKVKRKIAYKILDDIKWSNKTV